MSKRIKHLGLVLCCAVALAGCKVQLNAGLAEQDANEIMAHLLSNGIVATKQAGEDQRFDVLVSKDQFSQAVETIGAAGLPRRTYTNVGEMFKNDGLVASPMQEHARYTFAKSQELASSISNVPGVVSVDVHIASPQADTPFGDAAKPSVSVMLKMNRADMSEDLIPQIKHLVSMGVEDVEYERVGVILTGVDTTTFEPKFTSVAGLSVHNSSVDFLKTVISSAAIGLLLFMGLCGFALRRARGNSQRKSLE